MNRALESIVSDYSRVEFRTKDYARSCPNLPDSARIFPIRSESVIFPAQIIIDKNDIKNKLTSIIYYSKHRITAYNNLNLILILTRYFFNRVNAQLC